MPGRLGACTVAGDIHIHYIGCAGAGGFDPSFKCGLEVGTGCHSFARQALAFRQLDEVDIGISQIHSGVMTRLGHLSSVSGETPADDLIVAIVPNHGEDRNPVASLGPEPRSAVHGSAIANGANHLPVGGRKLRSRGSTYSPAQGASGGPHVELFVVPHAKMECVVAGGVVLVDHDGVRIDGLGHDRSQLIGMHRALAHVLARLLLRLGPLCGGESLYFVGPRSSQGLDTFLGCQAFHSIE